MTRYYSLKINSVYFTYSLIVDIWMRQLEYLSSQFRCNHVKHRSHIHKAFD